VAGLAVWVAGPADGDIPVSPAGRWLRASLSGASP